MIMPSTLPLRNTQQLNNGSDVTMLEDDSSSHPADHADTNMTSSQRRNRSRRLSVNNLSIHDDSGSDNENNCDDDDEVEEMDGVEPGDGDDCGGGGGEDKQYMLDDATFIAAKKSINVRSKLYGDMIQAGQGFEDKNGINGFDLGDFLTENTIKGHQLGSIKTSCSTDMFNAFLHTNMCSRMIKFQSEKVGDTKVFNANKYLLSVKQMGRNACKKLSKIYSTSSTVPTSYLILGTFDKGSSEAGDGKKTKKTPVRTRRKRDFDENLKQATQHEEVELNQGGSGAGGGKKPTNHAEVVSTSIFKVLKTKSRQREEPFNLFEFTTNKESIDQTVQNMFYMGFLIRDGHASLTRKEPDSQGPGDADLVVKPDVPPKKNEQNGQQGTARNQHIVSFSAKLYRKMLAVAQGETEIPPIKIHGSTTVEPPEERRTSKK